MTREEIISGLKFTVEMFLYNPSTGEKYTEPRNDMDKTTIDACKGAIELLEQMPDIAKYYEEHGEVVVDRAVWEGVKRVVEPAYWTKDFICSNCGCKCYPCDIDFGDFNYCPNCGHPMEEGDHTV